MRATKLGQKVNLEMMVNKVGKKGEISATK